MFYKSFISEFDMTITYPMYNAGGMKMLDAAEHLVKEVGHALVVQIHLDHLAEVCVHQLHHQVHVLKLLQGALGGERVQ